MARNWTQNELGTRAGLSQNAIKRLEGAEGCFFSTYILACKALGLPLNYILSTEWTVPKQIPTLAHRQAEVLEALAKGGSLADAGKRLGMSGYSVASHLSRIYERLGVTYEPSGTRRADAIRIARQYNLIKKDSNDQTDG
jgi:DNA-binding NarL/FixJ family response regulator